MGFILIMPLIKFNLHYFLANFLNRIIYFDSYTLRKKVRKLSLGRHLFKRYTFVPKGCILVPSWYIFVPLGTKVYLFEKVPPQ